MNTEDRSRVIPWACAAIALVVSVIAVGTFLKASDGNLTALIRMAPEDPIVPLVQQHEEEVFFVPAGHYDGVYYYAIALDPFATGQASKLIDLPAHRYGHPAYGWLAWIASAGNPSWVPQALLIVSLAGMAAGAYITSLIGIRLGMTPWAGLVIALNPGLVFSVTTDTSEAITAAVLALALLLWLKDRSVPAGLLMIFLCFFKFQMVLVPVALGGWELLQYLRGHRDSDTFKNIGLLAVGPILFIIWMLYVGNQFGELPISGGPEFLALPFVGWFGTLGDISHIEAFGFQDVQIASAQIPILVCLLALIVFTLLRSLRLRHPLDAVFLLQGAFLLLLNWYNLLYPKDLIRVLAIPIPLLFAVLYLGRPTVPAHHAETP